ncbi:MAG: DUF4342 domain-containing protein [Dehalococcoidia bacterium]|nr:DUF4342 domain-containing protein [Dehalococcoidia bacterium]
MADETTERFEINADQLVERFKRLVHEGNVRRVTIKQGNDTIAEFPLTIGVVGAVLAPVLAAVGALAALLAQCTIEVVRTTPAASEAAAPPVDSPAI